MSINRRYRRYDRRREHADGVEPQADMRLCAFSHQLLPKQDMLRFALAPDGTLVLDLREKLGGRGCWFAASGGLSGAADYQKLLQKQFQRKVILPEQGLHEAAGQHLLDALKQTLGLLCRAGQAMQGTVKVDHALHKEASRGILLVLGDISSLQGRQKMITLAHRRNIKVMAGLPETIGLDIFKRERLAYIFLHAGGLAEKFTQLAEKWFKLHGMDCFLQSDEGDKGRID